MTLLTQLAAALADRYAVEREIGAGGMATVYLARDLKHDRLVALKVLNPELGALLGVERFLAEIRVTASLQHPNLLPLFDSGEAAVPGYGPPGAGLLFYVMPYIEGESLRALLDREKQLPIEEAVRITSAIAGALDFAHRHGVIHRDLKPENILLLDGQPLLADFGIALAVSKAGGNRITQTGLSLGTPAYMSPEQATGDRNIDGRTDLYSLGAILYEMLVGEPPHIGATSQSVIAKVLTEKPRPIHLSRPAVSPHIEHAVERALAKLPADRYASGRAFVDALEGRTNSTALHVAPEGAVEARPSRRRHDLLIIGLTVALIASTAFAYRESRAARSTVSAGVVQFELPETPADGMNPQNLELSPDGRRLAYVAQGSDGKSRVYIRDFKDLHARALPGTEEAVWPFFSPDGNWLGYFAQAQIWKVNLVNGGEPIAIAGDVSSARGAAWISASTIIASLDGRLVSVPAGGGAFTILPEDSTPLRLSRWYPLDLGDGDHIAFVYWRGTGPNASLAIVSRRSGRIDSGRVRGMFPIGMVGDRLFFIDHLHGISAVNVDEGHFVGKPEVVMAPSGLEPGGVSLTAAGTLVYRRSQILSEVVLRQRGVDRVVSPAPAVFNAARISPDGKRIAVDMETAGRTDIYVITIATGAIDRLTTEGLQNSRPEWTPDGKVLFQSDRDGPFSLWTQAIDGKGSATRLLAFPDRDIWQGVFSRDGRYLAYRTGTLATADIWYRQTAGDTSERPVANTPVVEQSPAFSPDGRWIAYASAAAGPIEIYIQPFPVASARYKVSRRGRDPSWSADGKSVFYSLGTTVMRASLNIGDGVTTSRIDTVLSGDVTVSAGIPPLSAGPDNTIVFLRTVSRPPAPVAVLGWTTLTGKR
jgi:serine/threonine-protein kinase